MGRPSRLLALLITPAIVGLVSGAALAGETRRVNVSSTGEQGNRYSLAPSISADGRYVAFGSNATNLVPGDTNGQGDVFVHDRGITAVTAAPVAPPLPPQASPPSPPASPPTSPPVSPPGGGRP